MVQHELIIPNTPIMSKSAQANNFADVMVNSVFFNCAQNNIISNNNNKERDYKEDEENEMKDVCVKKTMLDKIYLGTILRFTFLNANEPSPHEMRELRQQLTNHTVQFYNKPFFLINHVGQIMMFSEMFANLIGFTSYEEALGVLCHCHIGEVINEMHLHRSESSRSVTPSPPLSNRSTPSLELAGARSSTPLVDEYEYTMLFNSFITRTQGKSTA